MNDFELDLTNATAIPDTDFDLTFKATYNGMMIESRSAFDGDQAPIPWDAGVAIDGATLIIAGGVGCSGFGSCVCKLPKKNAKDVYRIYVEPKETEPEAWQEYKQQLEAAGIVLKEMATVS